jgi:hypothetical protein
MATLLAKDSGNFTDASTWGLVDSASLVDSVAAISNISTTYVNSPSFSPGAITIDGVAVRIASRTITTTATFFLQLFNVTTSTQIAEVSIAVNDLPATTSAGSIAPGLGWVFFRFGAPITLVSGQNYAIGLRVTTANHVVCYRNATANNWTRLLRTTTNAAPAASDILHIAPEFSAPATYIARTVTMNNTSSTLFGDLSVPNSISISNHCSLRYGVAASTNYRLRVRGLMGVFAGGKLEIGSTVTPIPATSSATLEFDGVANVDSGLGIGSQGNFETHGNTKTTTNTLLTSTANAGTSILNVLSTAGWQAGDRIAIASTSRTPTEAEDFTISTVNSPTQITLSGALAFTHEAVGDVVAEVINLTRNVKIFGNSSTIQSFVVGDSSDQFHCRDTEFYYLGSGTTARRGITVQATYNSCIIERCAIHSAGVTSSLGLFFGGGINSVVQVLNNSFYDIAAQLISISTSVFSAMTISDNYGIRARAGGGVVLSTVNNKVVTNNRISSCTGYGFSFSQDGAIIDTFDGNISHSNGTSTSAALGFSMLYLRGVLSNCIAYRNAAPGFLISGCQDLYLTNCKAFGNGVTNIDMTTIGSPGVIGLYDSIIDAGATLTSPIGLRVQSGGCGNFDADNCTFGATNEHSTGDIVITTPTTTFNMRADNCLFASTNPFVFPERLTPSSIVGFSAHNQIPNNHLSIRRTGRITIDTIIFDTSPSMRLTPTSSTEKLRTGRFDVPVRAGESLTVSVKVRRSVAGDGAAYNGALPRLFLRKAAALGVNSEIILATATVLSSGAFETLTGTTPVAPTDGVFSFGVDCDGTTGWINIDSWSVTP